jgi:aromatic-L-amino-acid decarboxylase
MAEEPYILDDRFAEDPEGIRAAAERFSDELVRAWSGAAERPVHPEVGPGDFAALADMEPPAEGIPLPQLLDELRRLVLPGLTQVASPRYLGMMNPAPALAAVLGESLAASLNPNCSLWHQSPAAAELEKLVVRWLCGFAGLAAPPAFGLLLSGGSMANITALKLARDRCLGPGARAEGLAGAPPAAVYASAEAHYSFEKGVDLVGLGAENLHRAPVDAAFRVDVPALRAMVRADAARGVRAACVVGVAGTTNTGSIDDLAALADVAAEAGAWFHVDAAYGGAALLLPELAARFRGLERADSVTLDPHKWFFVPFECAALLVRRRADLRAAFATRPHYYLEQGLDDDRRVNFFEHGLQGSRAFRALKLWLALRSFGLDAYRRIIRRHCEYAAGFHATLESAGGFETFHRPELGLVCFRAVPAGGAGAASRGALDDLNRRIHRRVELEGRFWISITRLRDGDVALRANFMNYRTRPADVQALGHYLTALRGEEIAR